MLQVFIHENEINLFLFTAGVIVAVIKSADMGHLPSTVKVPEWSEVHRQAASIRDIALLSYDDFVKSINDLNEMYELLIIHVYMTPVIVN